MVLTGLYLLGFGRNRRKIGAKPGRLTVYAAQDGTLSTVNLTIPAGSLASEAVSVAHAGNEAVTVAIESAAFGRLITYEGVQVALGQPLTWAVNDQCQEL